MENSYKMNKYISKMQNCNDLIKKMVYQQKINHYQEGYGLFDKNSGKSLIVFNSKDIRGSNIEKFLNSQADQKDINAMLMKQDELKNLLANGAYKIDDKNKDSLKLNEKGKAEKFSPKYKAPSITDGTSSLLKNVNNISSNIKEIKSNLKKIKEESDKITRDHAKDINDIQTIKTNYDEKKIGFEKRDYPEKVLSCTMQISQKTEEILKLLNDRNTKMSNLTNEINDSTSIIEEKITSLGNLISEIQPFESQIQNLVNKYNKDSKENRSAPNEFISCITSPDVLETEPYTGDNYLDIAKEIKNAVKDTLNLDSYMIVTFKTLSSNTLHQIGKI